MNFCFPKPNMRRNSSRRYAQVITGAGAATDPSSGKKCVAGSSKPSSAHSKSRLSHGKISAIATSSDR
jgi:hypothetical protein